jgi:hypothetical protein
VPLCWKEINFPIANVLLFLSIFQVQPPVTLLIVDEQSTSLSWFWFNELKERKTVFAILPEKLKRFHGYLSSKVLYIGNTKQDLVFNISHCMIHSLAETIKKKTGNNKQCKGYRKDQTDIKRAPSTESESLSSNWKHRKGYFTNYMPYKQPNNDLLQSMGQYVIKWNAFAA